MGLILLEADRTVLRSGTNWFCVHLIMHRQSSRRVWASILAINRIAMRLRKYTKGQNLGRTFAGFCRVLDFIKEFCSLNSVVCWIWNVTLSTEFFPHLMSHHQIFPLEQKLDAMGIFWVQTLEMNLFILKYRCWNSILETYAIMHTWVPWSTRTATARKR